MSNRVIVRGGAPGMIRVEVENTELGVDVSSALNAYQAAHELAAFMGLLLQAVPPGYDLAEPKATKSVAPKAHK